ncbi:acid-sensing ion channel 1-like isoform X2 [Varroa jacobsoni]|uniref:acid-sensing ion channel 1-like isoform X2 n=1 Tax=Varroa jacobsoni TaxID=62625 RepID=UPI000BF38AF9|nr:acid-sensing ion channel 1-like isoform X2 [Varroa jacobsoni]
MNNRSSCPRLDSASRNGRSQQRRNDPTTSNDSEKKASLFSRGFLRLLRHIRKPSWLIVFQLLFSEATLPGLKDVFGFSPPLARLMFATVFLYLVHTTVTDISQLVISYLAYNTSLQVKIEEPKDGPMSMPAVTICNQNPLLLSKLCLPANRNYIETETNKTCNQPNCETFISVFYERLCLRGDAERDKLRLLFGSSKGQLAAEKASALMGFEKGREVLTELSYPEIASTVNACFFNGVDCRSLITKSLHPFYGVCFCVYCKSQVEVTTFETPTNGLMLNLKVNEDEYLPMIPNAGHLLMIHNKDEQISVSEDSIPVYPLATTYIGLQREQLIRLPAPSNYPCTESYPAEVAVHLTSEDKQKYSKLLCQDMCTQMAIYRECRCIDFKYRLPQNLAATECSYVLGQPTGKNARHNDTLRCARETARRVEKATFRCGCLPPCQVDFYHKVISALFWHPDVQRESLGVERLCNSTVYVYMQSNKITVRRKVMQISPKDLLNSIAGTMGIYLGYSYLFAFYIIDILVRGVAEIVCWHIFKAKQLARYEDARLQA